jgi:hypothetical protein
VAPINFAQSRGESEQIATLGANLRPSNPNACWWCHFHSMHEAKGAERNALRYFLASTAGAFTQKSLNSQTKKLPQRRVHELWINRAGFQSREEGQ